MNVTSDLRSRLDEFRMKLRNELVAPQNAAAGLRNIGLGRWNTDMSGPSLWWILSGFEEAWQ